MASDDHPLDTYVHVDSALFVALLFALVVAMAVSYFLLLEDAMLALISRRICSRAVVIFCGILLSQWINQKVDCSPRVHLFTRSLVTTVDSARWRGREFLILLQLLF